MSAVIMGADWCTGRKRGDDMSEEYVIPCDTSKLRSSYACDGKLHLDTMDGCFVILKCDACFRLQVYKKVD